ncbi:lysophospholipase catalytic domain-containing protein [Diplogelasinospora grovesii]|uniref:Lysophospholipase n=1 Tax=Diplogelasinospora grovesii TaxID=303347 RepID=A0AAN6S8X0_9PEZI|nr:lysophospholipase catalytic domain-containing protein [Diplogelasinospora grovesii]
MQLLSGLLPATLLPILVLSVSAGSVATRVGDINGAREGRGPLREAAIEAAVIKQRMLPNAPSGDYAPTTVPCSAGSGRPTIRKASGLSRNETEWLATRRKSTVEPMLDLLKRANISDFDVTTYINNAANNVSALPNIAIAVSGGGYRALLNGAGFVAAADCRTAGTTDKGGIGGLLQASTYLAGLSGGGWLVGSIYANNFSTVTDLRDGSPGSNVWQFDNPIFTGPKESGISIVNTASYWYDIYDQVSHKSDAGFETTITDYWGRALSYQLINATDGGPAYTFSSISLTPSFSGGQTPFPILVADGRAPGTEIVSLNATVYEFNPYEMGSFDPTTYGFAPVEYLGSNFTAGTVPSNGHCVRGFDQAGFVMGTSSSLFNTFLLNNVSTQSAASDIPSLVVDALEAVLKDLGQNNEDIAQYTPNPFYEFNNETNYSAGTMRLDLVDGGEDLQNIPLHPLTQPVREVDVIFAVDSSADTDVNWPNGTAMRATYDRSLSPIANGTLFPPVPDANTFINLGLNNRPTFFGCDPNNFTLKDGQRAPPLVVYVPNAPYTAMSNVSTFTLEYSDAQRNDIIQNGLNAGSQGNSTLDAQWPTCVACAILNRSLGRTGTAIPQACKDCFERYCWNGTLDDVDKGPYRPTFKIANGTTTTSTTTTGAASRSPAGLFWAVAIIAGLWILAP